MSHQAPSGAYEPPSPLEVLKKKNIKKMKVCQITRSHFIVVFFRLARLL